MSPFKERRDLELAFIPGGPVGGRMCHRCVRISKVNFNKFTMATHGLA